MSQTEILIYITVIQWTTAIFGGHFLAAGSIVEGVSSVTPAEMPGVLTFLADTIGFFVRAFVFAIPGAPLLSPLWILMGVIWLVLFANFLRTGLT
jgi:hypothetical protein